MILQRLASPRFWLFGAVWLLAMKTEAWLGHPPSWKSEALQSVALSVLVGMLIRVAALAVLLARRLR